MASATIILLREVPSEEVAFKEEEKEKQQAKIVGEEEMSTNKGSSEPENSHENTTTGETQGKIGANCERENETSDHSQRPNSASFRISEENTIHSTKLDNRHEDEQKVEKDDHVSTKDNGPLVDVTLIPSKLSYFFMECFGGSFVPFIVVFLHSTGLSLTEAGFITGIRLLSSSIAAPLWGCLADHTGRRNLIFAILCVGMASTIFPMPWVGKACSIHGKSHHSANKSVSLNNTYFLNEAYSISYKGVTLNYTSFHNEGDLLGDKRTQLMNEDIGLGRYGLDIGHLYQRKYELKGVEKYREDTSKVPDVNKSFSSTLFYVMLSLVFVSNIFSNPINGIVDSFVMNVVKSHHRKSDYGKQRMFGAIGFGVSNLLAGMAADYYKVDGISKYTAIFYVFLPSVLLLLPCGLVLGSQTTVQVPEENHSQSHSKLKLLKETFKNPDNMMFLLSTFVIGVINAVVIGYMFKLMEDQMNATKTVMGLSNMVASLAEIIVFPFSGKILLMCGGGIGGIMLAMFSYFLRLLMVAYIRNPWLVLPTQILNCLSFALFWTSAMEYTQKIAPKEIYITMFSIINSVYFNVAGLLGYLVGGMFYDAYGGKILFLVSGIVSGAWVVVMVMYYHVYRRFRRRRVIVNPKVEMPSTFSIDTVV